MSSSQIAPHFFEKVHFPKPTWCSFCSKFIWGLGKQGYQCKVCKDYPVHPKCLELAKNNTSCKAQKIIDPHSKREIKRDTMKSLKDLVATMQDSSKGVPLKERKTLLKNLGMCFTGADATDWMVIHLPIRDRTEALEMGNKLTRGGYIKRQDKNDTEFKDNKDALYSFNNSRNSEAPEAEEPSAVETNVTESDFQVLETIGKGGFGQVCKVKKKDNGKIYAMKIMNKTKISGQKQLQCLIAEKNIMLNDNPFLVHLHYSFANQERLYFVMDYISGGDIAYHLEKKTRFSEREVRFITAEIVLALAHLHSCAIVYRDLKLENILLDSEGHVCLTDFGLSKELEEISATTQTICGTPTYLAPELLLRQPYGNAIDWWSLGVVTFELFTGSNPFDDRDLNAVMSNILHKNIPAAIPDYVSPTGKDLIERLLQRVPTKRLCSGPTGSAEIQHHDFYKEIQWKKLMVKALKPPFRPREGQNFDPSLLDQTAPPEGKGAIRQLDEHLDNFSYVSSSVTESGSDKN